MAEIWAEIAMKPLSAVGLTSNIASSINYANKLISGAIELCNLAVGKTADHAELEEVVTRGSHMSVRE